MILVCGAVSGILTAWGMTDRKVTELLFFSWIPIIPAAVFWCIFIFKAWKAIQDDHTVATPGKALGFMFIPFFNLYWLFIAIGSWGKEYNGFARRNKLNVEPMSEGVFIAWAVLILLPVPIANLVLTIIGLVKMASGTNALADARE